MIRENEIDTLLPSINLKMSIMNKFMVIAIAYFGFELIINGLIPSVELAAKQTTRSSSSSSRSYNPWEEVMQQYYDLCIIVAILLVYRPRYWPELFSVGLYDGEAADIAQANQLIVDEYKVVPFYCANIDNKVLHSSQGVPKRRTRRRRREP